MIVPACELVSTAEAGPGVPIQNKYLFFASGARYHTGMKLWHFMVK